MYYNLTYFTSSESCSWESDHNYESWRLVYSTRK